MYLLDTNVLSETLRPLPDAGVMGSLKRHSRELSTATPVIHEMLFGALRLPPGPRRESILREIQHVFLRTLDVLPYDLRAAEWHAHQRARLANDGRTPPHVDGQIAAIAAVNGMTLVTRNVTDFAAFEGLSVEDWFTG
jgi:tRNA(fMet)-specific endonuclease VapC